MNPEFDPFDPANLQVSDDTIRSLNGELGKRLVWDKTTKKFVEPKDAPVTRNPKFKFTQLPVEGLGKLGAQKRFIPLLVILRLEELWFTSFKRNPVKLAAFEMRGVKVAHHTKTRALVDLEAAGLISVKRYRRKTSLVTLLWRPILK